MFDLRDVAVPIAGAPMAGGPGTPGLAAAVCEAGGLGFYAGGYLSAQGFADGIAALRSATAGPIGVNLFVPQPSVGTAGELDGYRALLAPVAQRYGAEPGQPRADDDDWAAKLDVVAESAPEVVSFTFGCPAPDILRRLRDRSLLTLVTVTTPQEAAAAVAAGAGGLVVQGPGAGGHRSTFDPAAKPSDVPLGELLAEIVAAHDVPIVAAGGLSDSQAVAEVLSTGAILAQVGTALLLADEAGTNPVHRQALSDQRFTETVMTRAFSGRYARGLANDFTRRYDPVAPLGYPDVHHITGPIRKAAVAARDPHGTNLWAGTGWRRIGGGSAADIVEALAADTR